MERPVACARSRRDTSPRYGRDVLAEAAVLVIPAVSRRFISAIYLGDISRRCISAMYLSAMYLTEAEGKHAERVAFGGTERLKRRARVDPLREIRRDQAEIAASGAHRSAV